MQIFEKRSSHPGVFGVYIKFRGKTPFFRDAETGVFSKNLQNVDIFRNFGTPGKFPNFPEIISNFRRKHLCTRGAKFVKFSTFCKFSTFSKIFEKPRFFLGVLLYFGAKHRLKMTKKRRFFRKFCKFSKFSEIPGTYILTFFYVIYIKFRR